MTKQITFCIKFFQFCSIMETHYLQSLLGGCGGAVLPLDDFMNASQDGSDQILFSNSYLFVSGK